jgi:hypothetical protein
VVVRQKGIVSLVPPKSRFRDIAKTIVCLIFDNQLHRLRRGPERSEQRPALFFRGGEMAILTCKPNRHCEENNDKITIKT